MVYEKTQACVQARALAECALAGAVVARQLQAQRIWLLQPYGDALSRELAALQREVNAFAGHRFGGLRRVSHEHEILPIASAGGEANRPHGTQLAAGFGV